MKKEKILLFGGTAESKDIARAIIDKGYNLTVSTASNDKLIVPQNLSITRKTGKMDEQEIINYLKINDFCAVICAVHPYAHLARNNITAACNKTNTPLFIYLRADTRFADIIEPDNIYYAPNHSEAAEIADKLTGNILLTTGSRNLEPYMISVKNSSTRIYARVLNCQESERALAAAGIMPDHAIFARGPFTVTDNIKLINMFAIQVLITKDGGITGGTPEKLEAASRTGSKVILITRPEVTDIYYTKISDFIDLL